MPRLHWKGKAERWQRLFAYQMHRTASILRPCLYVMWQMQKKVPDDFITLDGHDVTEKMTAYLKPLIQGNRVVICENGITKHIELY